MTWRAWSARLTVSSAPVARRALLDDRIGDLAQGGAHGMDASEVARGGESVGWRACARSPIGALAVDHAAIDEPGQGVVEGRQVLDRETILEVVGVQEVEGVVEADVVGVARWPGGQRCVMSITTLDLLTGYAQAGTVHE